MRTEWEGRSVQRPWTFSRAILANPASEFRASLRIISRQLLKAIAGNWMVPWSLWPLCRWVSEPASSAALLARKETAAEEVYFGRVPRDSNFVATWTLPIPGEFLQKLYELATETVVYSSV